MLLIICAIIGLGAGVLGGLLGISGGVITVPCLVYLFKYYEFSPTHLVQLAIGTSLAAMVFNTASSMLAHQRKGAIRWIVVFRMLPGLILGCAVGAYFAHLLPSFVLEIMFGCFAITLGVYFYFHKNLAEIDHNQGLSNFLLTSLGFGVGAISNILGIGGGTLTVPLFAWLKMSIKASVASSTATGLIISLTGALSYLLFGLGETYYVDTLGFIYIPAFIVLAITTFVAAPFGAYLSHRLETHHLKKVFAVCLVIVGIAMVFRQ